MKRTFSKIRLSILGGFLLFATYEAVMHQLRGGASDGTPSIHALCAFGALESLFSLFTAGTLIQKIYSGTFVLLIVTVITALLFRRGFCGWICPFGGLQELMGRLGKKVLGKQLKMPVKADGILRYLKYVILGLTIVMAWITASIWMFPYDPWAAYGHLGEGLQAVWAEFAAGLIILVVTLAGSFFYDRFFCKYLCPLGGFLSLVAKISPFKIKRDSQVCTDCGLCTKACPVNIQVAALETVTSGECLNCQKCTAACPTEGALTSSLSFRSKRTMKPLTVGALLLLLYFGGIGLAKVTGKYQLLPAPVTAETVITDTESLRGYMTLQDISFAMKISPDEVYRRMGIPGDVPADTAAKDLGEYIPGFDFHSARDSLAE